MPVNIAIRDLPFELIEEDTRKAYGERRFQVLGGAKLHTFGIWQQAVRLIC
jgi:hypothetical protein